MDMNEDRLCPKCNRNLRKRRRLKSGKYTLRKYCSSCEQNPETLKAAWKRKNIKKHPYRAFKKDKCERCGFEPENPVQLDVDHIDGNHSNNDPENLMTLCANCHRLKSYVSGDGWIKQSRKAS